MVSGADARPLWTKQRSVARAATEDAFDPRHTDLAGNSEVSLVDEADSIAPVTDVHDVPTDAELAASLSTAPSTLPPPSAESVAAAGPTPACPQCDAPMAWVEEHLRFYCKQCRMYF